MPKPSASTKRSVPRTSKTTSKSLSWQSQLRLRYIKPLAFVFAFMVVGVATIVWTSAATTTYGFWDNGDVPRTISSSDTKSVELGMKFRSKVAGYVTGVRFYKGAQNTGTHTGSLWSSQGRQLATVTFKNETSSGWQTATFDQPVSVAANVTYVVSYHAPQGRYSLNKNFLKRYNYTHKKLEALQSRQGNPNSVYKYSNATTMPNQSADGAIYWVDVVFTNKLFNAPQAPSAPSNVVANLSGSKNVVVSWQASASANPVKNYEVYRNGDKIATTTSAMYTDTTTAQGKTYDYQVKAIDSNNTASVLSAKVTVAVPAAPVSGGGGTGGTSGGSTGGNTGGGTGGSTGGNSNGGSTGGSNTGNTADLFNASKKEMAMRLVSSAENSSLDWKAQYAYIEDIGDGRGYTGGIIGFCSGTSDMLAVVEYYNQIAPNNVLSKYIAALKKVDGTDSHAGLGDAFVADWKTAAKDAKFQQSQDYMRDLTYFNPAVNQAKTDGVRALGQFIYYDAIVMHGPGSDPVSFGGIRATAMKKAKTPTQGGDETAYLNAFLDARKAAMLTEEAHEDVDRVETAQRVFLKAGNFDLNAPLNWTMYGDAFSITKNP
jgi:chitosanase